MGHFRNNCSKLANPNANANANPAHGRAYNLNANEARADNEVVNAMPRTKLRKPLSVEGATATEVRSFLGLAGYYRQFISNFSKIAVPLTSLTQKNKTFEWGLKQEEAFQTLKQKLCDAPVLSLPEGNDDFVVYCDASNLGLGCILMQ
ncbi:uncharacterized mitochondrial protein AtMg00860-like [Helianthus annuus]|uniref:uncharacterized mitochondrial protein AtMg00860-like n=1 Tax=Helianthus annuus TaxID=4232 RepID=UPI000B8F74C4|nr:uncharacterized mitochondrial protein AtMg00860-like [Helianthus annuus]